MIKLASSGCAYDSRVRLVTLEILIASLKLIVIRYNLSVKLFSSDRSLRKAYVRFFVCSFIRASGFQLSLLFQRHT